jgi:membrane protease subunit HflK
MSERNVSAFGFNLKPKFVIVLIVLAVAAWGLFQSVYIVDQTEEAVVLTFGKYSRTEGPGMRFKFPLIEDNFNVPTKAVQKMDFGFRTTGGDFFGNDDTKTDFRDESTMLTGDLNIVDVTWIIQYRITDARAWLFNLDADSREKTIRDITQAVVSQLVGDRAILDVLGNERQAIETQATDLINERFAAYGIGVLVTGVQLKDIFPPKGNVRDAFDDVNAAFQDMNKLINQGRETYNKRIPEAAGEAQQAIQVAQGYATERVNRAAGDVARFKAVLGEYRRAPEVTRNRLYLETMETVFKSADSTDLVDKKLSGFLPVKTLGGKTAPAPAPDTQPAPTAAPGGN